MSKSCKYDELAEHFCTAFFIVHLYGYILHEFLFYSNWYSFIFQPAYSSSGLQVAGAYSKREPILDRTPSHLREHLHTHTFLMGHLDMLVNLMYTSLGYGRKLEYREKTHAYMGKNVQNSTMTVALARNLFFSYQCWTKLYLMTCCTWCCPTNPQALLLFSLFFSLFFRLDTFY